jgi:maltooligosyltrehalose trehalohydrolase
MRLAHAMPFGAECRAGATRFRLWAPSSTRVGLELGRSAPRVLEMQAQEDGWHELVVPGVGAGAAYAFRVDDGRIVPDPASRANPWDVGGPSMVVDPRDFEWDDGTWRGRPWHEAVVYELHVGTFTGEGTFAAAIARLDHVAALGVTAIELMPVADFAGARNWGYDGVLPFAPDAAYGFPEDLKRLVEAAHARGLMVLLDVVYNHFGPEGNHLGAYAKPFFNEAHKTPWGAAINFDGVHARTVRDFFVHNALYWIVEFHLDGLRLDAVHAIADDSPVHIVEEVARAIAEGPGRERHVHVVLENDANSARLLERGATAQWNDDAHHAFHVLLTGERDGYYADYAAEPARHLARALAEGFAWQGEASGHRGGERRGEPSAHLPLTAFMPFLQNHDQVGNRALGERLALLAPPERVRLALAILLLAPSVPLLFMGEEFGARTPFLYFCDFEGELARAVRDGRRHEFASFARFADERAREAIPDPGDEATFFASRLDWESAGRGEHAAALEHCRRLLALRASALVPRLARGARGKASSPAPGIVVVDWTLGDGARLGLRANLGDAPAAPPPASGEVLHTEGADPSNATLAGWSAVWTLDAGGKG